MSLVPQRPEGGVGGPAPHSFVDPRLARETRSARWAVQAARWRAVDLAVTLFGEGVVSRLQGTPGRVGLQGLLHLDVPFVGLDEHREKERAFVTAAAGDPVLAEVPLLFVFGIRQGTGVGAGAGADDSLSSRGRGGA